MSVPDTATVRPECYFCGQHAEHSTLMCDLTLRHWCGGCEPEFRREERWLRERFVATARARRAVSAPPRVGGAASKWAPTDTRAA